MKTTRWMPVCLLVLCLAACTARPTPQPALLKTDIGDLVTVSARTVKEVNGTAATPGKKILLVIVERADKTAIDLQRFQDAHMEIFVQGDDGSNTMSTMAGLVGQNHDEFAVGFMLPVAVKTYTLAWGENPPLEISAAK